MVIYHADEKSHVTNDGHENVAIFTEKGSQHKK